MSGRVRPAASAGAIWLDAAEPGDAPDLRIRGGRPVPGPLLRMESQGIKRLADLRPVSGDGLEARPGRRIQYWTFSGVGDAEHYHRLAALPVSYDLTVMSSRALGWELPKTHGHSHVRPDGAPGGYPEVYQVLHGQAGFMFQDLLPGPATTLATMVIARKGQLVVIPPLVHHCTINMTDSILVVANLVCRTAGHDYRSLREAHGMAYYPASENNVRSNRYYLSIPPLQVYQAAEWSAQSAGSLYGALLRQPDSFDWLCDPIDAIALPVMSSPRLSPMARPAENSGTS